MNTLNETHVSETPESPTRRPLQSLREEMDDLLSRFFRVEDGWLSGRLTPSVDVSETDNSVEVRMDLPGINPEQVDLEVRGKTLLVRGDRSEQPAEKGRTFHRRERRNGEFARSIDLPCDVVEDEVVAEYTHGVLTVTLPKCEEARAHKIRIKCN